MVVFRAKWLCLEHLVEGLESRVIGADDVIFQQQILSFISVKVSCDRPYRRCKREQGNSSRQYKRKNHAVLHTRKRSASFCKYLHLSLVMFCHWQPSPPSIWRRQSKTTTSFDFLSCNAPQKLKLNQTRDADSSSEARMQQQRTAVSRLLISNGLHHGQQSEPGHLRGVFSRSKNTIIISSFLP